MRTLRPLMALALLLAAPRALAHRDDYIDETFVYQTLEALEVEPELWAEVWLGRGREPLGVYTGALEFGITDRWMADAALQWVHEAGGVALGRIRLETRYRFAEEGAWPVDVATSLEYEREGAAFTGAEVEHTLTPRLVLSRDVVPKLNTTLNLDLPVRLSGEREVSFAYALGLRYPDAGFVRAGVELKHDVLERRARVMPQVWFALPAETTLKLGLGVGLTHNEPLFTGRVALEVEL